MSELIAQAQRTHYELIDTVSLKSNQTTQDVPEVTVIRIDPREQFLTMYLTEFDHPLKPERYYAKQFIEIADAYKLDYRLLPAIAMTESTMCKRIPIDSYNCFGFGIYGGNVLRFESFEAGFERVARSLREKYVNQGLTTPITIEGRYAPSSNGHWSGSVTKVMNSIQDTQASVSADVRR